MNSLSQCFVFIPTLITLSLSFFSYNSRWVLFFYLFFCLMLIKKKCNLFNFSHNIISLTFFFTHIQIEEDLIFVSVFFNFYNIPPPTTEMQFSWNFHFKTSLFFPLLSSFSQDNEFCVDRIENFSKINTEFLQRILS